MLVSIEDGGSFGTILVNYYRQIEDISYVLCAARFSLSEERGNSLAHSLKMRLALSLKNAFGAQFENAVGANRV